MEEEEVKVKGGEEEGEDEEVGGEEGGVKEVGEGGDEVGGGER
jgi:hypothetical protein